MLRWLFRLVLLLVALVAGAYVAGLALPVDHVASVERVLPSTPETVWEALTDTTRFPEWRTGVSEVRAVPDAEGRTRWIEVTEMGDLPIVIESEAPPARLVTRIADSGLPFGGTWTYELRAVPGGTRLTITENGEVYNPIFRLLSRFVFGHASTIEQYLGDMEAHLHSSTSSHLHIGIGHRLIWASRHRIISSGHRHTGTSAHRDIGTSRDRGHAAPM